MDVCGEDSATPSQAEEGRSTRHSYVSLLLGRSPVNLRLGPPNLPALPTPQARRPPVTQHVHAGTVHRWISLLQHRLCKQGAADQLLHCDNLGFNLDLQVGGENRYMKQANTRFSSPFQRNSSLLGFFFQFSQDT